MSESSAEKSEKPAEPVATQEKQEPEAKVPVAALAKERAEKRAARDKAQALEQQLAEAKEQNPQLDIQALMEAISQTIDARAQEAFEKVAAPLAAEASLLKSALSLGLNESQAKALSETKAKFPGMTDQQALTLVRAEKADLFPQPMRPARTVTGLPQGGESPFRSQAEPDHRTLMNEAVKAGDRGLAQKHATAGFLDALRRARVRGPS